jgi:hypothetical protein
MIEDSDDAPEEHTPEFFNRLSTSDQASYLALQADLGRTELRYNRFHRLETIQSIFDATRAFCMRGDYHDGTRSAVCGIAWLAGEELALNTRQLRILIAKSKSSINGAIAKMNYIALPARESEIERLCLAMPILRGNARSVRQWTIRRRAPQPPHDFAQVPAQQGEWETGEWDNSPVFDFTVTEKWGNEEFSWQEFESISDTSSFAM